MLSLLARERSVLPLPQWALPVSLPLQALALLFLQLPWSVLSLPHGALLVLPLLPLLALLLFLALLLLAPLILLTLGVPARLIHPLLRFALLLKLPLILHGALLINLLLKSTFLLEVAVLRWWRSHWLLAMFLLPRRSPCLGIAWLKVGCWVLYGLLGVGAPFGAIAGDWPLRSSMAAWLRPWS